MRSLYLFFVLALLVITQIVGVSLGASEELLFDYEEEELSQQWAVQGYIQVARGPLPEKISSEEVGVLGFGVMIQADKNSMFFTKQGIVPSDWRSYENLVLWIYRSPKEALQRKSSSFEVRVIESDKKTLFWRKLEVDHQGWKRFDLPLRWFGWGEGRIPRWDRVLRLVFFFRDPGEIWIDNITLVKGEGGTQISQRELSETAFPSKRPDDIRSLATNHVLLLSDSEDLDLEKLAGHFEEVAVQLKQEFSFLEESFLIGRLIVFANEIDYRSFPQRMAKRMNMFAGPAGSDSFTIHGVATSFYKNYNGGFRPVYTQSFALSLISNAAFLDNSGEWFLQGLATHYQVKFHPQDSLTAIISEGIQKKDYRLSLQRLCNGDPIPMNRSWQAMTVVEFLMNSPKYKGKFPALVRAFQDSGSTNLNPHLQNVLQANWQTLENDWIAYCKMAYIDR